MARKAKAAEPVTFSSGSIEKLHGALACVFARHIHTGAGGRGPVIDQPGAYRPGAWKRAQVDKIEFELQQLDETADRPRTREKVQVGQIAGFETVWVSWYERWRVGLRVFVPDSISLAFWVGEKSAAKELLFRAEWDHAATITADGAAQPHWNIDHPIGASVVLGEREPAGTEPGGLVALASEPVLLEAATEEPRGLVELTTPSGLEGDVTRAPAPMARRYTISRYHLGMAGSWATGVRGRGWQLPLADEAERLPDWLDLCLGHVAREIGEYGVERALE